MSLNIHQESVQDLRTSIKFYFFSWYILIFASAILTLLITNLKYPYGRIFIGGAISYFGVFFCRYMARKGEGLGMGILSTKNLLIKCETRRVCFWSLVLSPFISCIMCFLSKTMSKEEVDSNLFGITAVFIPLILCVVGMVTMKTDVTLIKEEYTS